MAEKKLQDPHLPAGAIVATHDDDTTLEEGQVRRNDGVVLNPAAKNPWYVLATVAGEHERTPPPILDFHLGLHARNRRIWNGWMCQHMDEAWRAALAEKIGLPPEDLAPLTEEERAHLNDRFSKAFPGDVAENRLPDPYEPVNAVATHFSNQLVLDQCVLGREALFYLAHFAGDAWLGSAHFGNVFFNGAHFAGFAKFSAAHLAGFYGFQSAYFAGPADFSAAHFGAGFFTGSHFASDADFSGALFTNGADFSNGAFASQSNFDGMFFKKGVLKFYHRAMHQDTSFTTARKNWPTATKHNADEGKRAYTRLRQIAAEAHNPDDAHFFLRQEMRCKKVLADPFHKPVFWLYENLSDYGYSVARPAAGLFFIWLLGAACFAGHFDNPAANVPPEIFDNRYVAAAGISFGNLFGFLGITRLYFADFLNQTRDALQFLAGAQTVAGVVLLFLLGLGLRNRFRLQ